MLRIMRSLGIAAWVGCILTLAYQSLTWVFTASWPSLTLMDAAYTLFGFDLASLVQKLPMNLAVKITYLLITTQLTLGLWWLGIFFFGLALIFKVILDK